MTNFRLFQTERVCRRQFQIRRKWQEVIQTGRKHCGKRRNIRYEQFLLFQQCFQKACFPGASKGGIVWEWINRFIFSFLEFSFINLKPLYKILFSKENNNYLPFQKTNKSRVFPQLSVEGVTMTPFI